MPKPTNAGVCWRCGAEEEDGAPLSGCTEKRGLGPPWLHEYLLPGLDHPWDKTYSTQELASLVSYLATKAMGSWMTATAFAEQEPSLAATFSAALYQEKAKKRTRLLIWAATELSRRIRREGVVDAHPHPA